MPINLALYLSHIQTHTHLSITMASMGFSQSTISELMSLVEDNKDNVSEATYVEICNAMKYLYDKKQNDTTTNSNNNNNSRQYERIYVDNNNYYTREELERMLNRTRFRLSNLSIRVDNLTKTRAIREKCREIGIQELEFETIRQIYNNSEVKRMEEILVASGVPLRVMKAKYQAVKQDIIHREQTEIINRIRYLEALLNGN